MGKLDRLVESRFVSTAEAAKLTGIPSTQLGNWCAAGYFGAKIGNRWIIDREDLTEFVGLAAGNPNFHSAEYQEKLTKQRREQRITAQEAAEALESPQTPPDPKPKSSIMMIFFVAS